MLLKKPNNDFKMKILYKKANYFMKVSLVINLSKGHIQLMTQ